MKLLYLIDRVIMWILKSFALLLLKIKINPLLQMMLIGGACSYLWGSPGYTKVSGLTIFDFVISCGILFFIWWQWNSLVPSFLWSAQQLIDPNGANNTQKTYSSGIYAWSYVLFELLMFGVYFFFPGQRIAPFFYIWGLLTIPFTYRVFIDREPTLPASPW